MLQPGGCPTYMIRQAQTFTSLPSPTQEGSQISSVPNLSLGYRGLSRQVITTRVYFVTNNYNCH